MIRPPKLSPRLAAAAAYVRPGDRVADVGCDHGQLSAFLALSGCSAVFACDVNPQPLAHARQTVAAYGVQDRVALLLSDGLRGLPQDLDTVVLAGMGGELICTLLFREEWLARPGMRLVLQPQSFAPLVRRQLELHGFAIREETPVVEPRHAYCILCADYTGQVRRLSEPEAVLGKMPQSPHPQAAAYLHRQYRKYARMAAGLAKAQHHSGLYHECREVLSALAPWKEQPECQQ